MGVDELDGNWRWHELVEHRGETPIGHGAGHHVGQRDGDAVTGLGGRDGRAASLISSRGVTLTCVAARPSPKRHSRVDIRPVKAMRSWRFRSAGVFGWPCFAR